MANKYLEQQVQHQKQIEKLQERLIYFTAISSIAGCALGGVLGYIAGMENAQKVADQKHVLVPEHHQKTIGE